MGGTIVRNYVQRPVSGFNEFLTSNPRLFSLTSLIQAITDGVEKIAPNKPSLIEMGKALTDFADIIDAMRLFNDLQKLTAVDKKGKFGFETDALDYAETVAWTGAHGVHAIRFMDTLKIIALSTTAAVTLNVVMLIADKLF